MREARFLSRINHQNILRYYSSWIECIETETDDQCHIKKQKQAKEEIILKNSYSSFRNKSYLNKLK